MYKVKYHLVFTLKVKVLLEIILSKQKTVTFINPI